MLTFFAFCCAGYLPRVKRAFEDIERVRKAVREERWPDVGVFVNEGGSLDDLVLPMRLYASGLSGQGLSLAAGFLKNMADDADKVEASVKVFRKALKKKDAAAVNSAVDDIERAVCCASSFEQRFFRLGRALTFFVLFCCKD